MLGGAQVQHVGYPTPNFSRGHSQLVAPVPPPQAVTVHGHFQQKSVGYTAEHQHVRGNIYHGQQTTPFQATTAINGYHQGPGGMQSQWREKNLQGGTPVIQAPTYQQPSSMQHLAGRMMRAPAPSTLTTSSGASGSTGGTFSSVASDQGGLQPRSSYGVHEYMNAPYGQVSATSQQDQCSHCHTWIQYVINPTTLKLTLSNMFIVPTATPVAHQLTINHMETMPPLGRFELDIARYMAATGAQAATDHSLGLAIF